MGEPDRGIHYMTDRTIIEFMIHRAKLAPTDTVLDIGAGKGALTAEIDKKAACIAVDIEKKHTDFLRTLPLKHTTIHEKNILDILPKLTFNKIVANIPYSISEPLFYELSKKEFDLAIMTIGERFYNVISTDTKAGIILRSQYELTYLRNVPKHSFSPHPRAQSCIIQLRKKQQQSETDRLIKAFLCLDNKKIKNALDTVFEKKIPRKEIATLSKKHAILNKNISALSNAEMRQFLSLLETLSAPT